MNRRMSLSWIEPGQLAASGLPFMPQDLAALHADGIRAIISLTEDPITRFRGMAAALSEYAMVYEHVPIADQQPPTLEQARAILDFIKAMMREGRPVLIHCMAGIGRTGTLLQAFYIDRGLSPTQARARVQRSRPVSALLSSAQRAFLDQFAQFARDVSR